MSGRGYISCGPCKYTKEASDTKIEEIRPTFKCDFNEGLHSSILLSRDLLHAFLAITMEDLHTKNRTKRDLLGTWVDLLGTWVH